MTVNFFLLFHSYIFLYFISFCFVNTPSRQVYSFTSHVISLLDISGVGKLHKIHHRSFLFIALYLLVPSVSVSSNIIHKFCTNSSILLSHHVSSDHFTPPCTRVMRHQINLHLYTKCHTHAVEGKVIFYLLCPLLLFTRFVLLTHCSLTLAFLRVHVLVCTDSLIPEYEIL